jgi:CBS domain-containing protein
MSGEIIDLMLDHKIGAVPVVDGDGMLAGIVSYVDILRSIEIEAGPVLYPPTRPRSAHISGTKRSSTRLKRGKRTAAAK